MATPNGNTSLLLKKEEEAAAVAAVATTAVAADQPSNRSTRTRPVPQWQEAVAGASAGAFSRTAMAPLERIKLLQQLQGSLAGLDKTKITTATTTTRKTNNPSAWSLARYVYQTEGLTSFWRGNLPSCLRVSGTAAINFTCMEYYNVAAVRPFLDSFYNNSNSIASQRQAQFWASLMSGGLAGATSTTVLYPLEFVRTRLAVDLGKSEKKKMAKTPTTTTTTSTTLADTTTSKTRQYRGMHHVFVDILRSDGIRGLFQGYGIALTGGIVYRVMYLGGYDAIKNEIQWQRDNNNNNNNSNTGGATTNTGSDSNTSSSSSTLTWTERFLVAETISVTAGTLSYPFDSVRRRMMMQAGMPLDQRLYRNSLHCIATVYSREGLLGFYLGLGPNLVRSVGGALMLVAYDVVRGLLE